MTWNDILTIWSGSLWVSCVIWAILANVFLYLARRRAHGLLRQAGRALACWLRAAARVLSGGRAELQAQQRDLHAAQACELAERRIERSTRRFAHLVDRDLAAFPQLQRRLTDQIERIDRDYHDSADTPPVPPQWLEAIDAVARTQSVGDSTVAGILDAMHGTLARASHDALDEFRHASRRRHGLLRRMLPQWRRATRLLASMNRHVAELSRLAESIDAQIMQYAALREQPPVFGLGVQMQYWLRFLFAAALLGALGVLASTQYTLLLPPLQHVLPKDMAAFGVPLAQLEAWVVIVAELVCGVLLLEFGRLARLLPALGQLEQRARRRAASLLAMLWLAIVAFACTLMILGAPAILGATQAVAVVLLALLLLPAGVLLDLALRSGPSATLSLLNGLLALAALSLRALGWLARLSGRLSVYVYDLVIFLPLAIELAISLRRHGADEEDESAATAG